MRLRNLIPSSLRLSLRRYKRYANDKRNGYTTLFCNKKNNHVFKNKIKFEQTINQSPQCKEKIHNIKLAANKISRFLIQPGELFSFWHCVGAANRKEGYLRGRSLIAGKVSSEFGGGLCQLSGIIYLCALTIGLKIIERHHHSIDIYTEEERFAPLGSDATVVYAYKDFRFINTSDTPFYFNFEIIDSKFHCGVHSASPLPNNKIQFKRTTKDGFIFVNTVINNYGQTIATSKYKTKELAKL